MALEGENRALEMLWGFVDAVSEKPRHGNVFDRAGEILDTLWRWRKRGGWFMRIAELMSGDVDTPGEDILKQVSELLSEIREQRRPPGDIGFTQEQASILNNDNVKMRAGLVKIRHLPHARGCTTKSSDTFCDCPVGIAAKTLTKEKAS